jgi:CheY-like chemotaxis protein
MVILVLYSKLYNTWLCVDNRIKKMKILIAENNQVLQDLNGELMNIWGYDYDIVSNGLEAVEHAQENEGEYDLCLMDLEMPVMNGLQATKIIRRKLSYFPILAFSGDPASREKCFKVGMDEFLKKPCFPDALLDKIKELTIKSFKLEFKGNDIFIEKEMPMNPDELIELRELDKKGLVKFSLINTGYKFIVHKNLQNKISHDFIAKGKKLSEFLDRSPDDPGIIHLYASNLHANKRHILPEVLEQLSQEENEDLKSYTTKAEYPEEENPE